MATAAVLSIGTEVTRGELINTNSAYLAEALTREGFEVTAIDTVADDAPRIEACLKRLGAEHDVIVSTGGLGPTTDDITTACVARTLGVGLSRDERTLNLIRELLARFGRTISESNAKQADFPEGAGILPNPNGTAPGFNSRIGRAQAFFMPGVPREMRPMFEDHVVPEIRPLVDERFHQVSLRTFGLPESEVNDRLAGVEQAFGVSIGYRVTFPTLEVKVLARAKTLDQARSASEAGAREVRTRLGEIVFGEGDVSLSQVLGQELLRRGHHLAAAESCTGGLLGQLLTARSGASGFFAGSAVVYENRAKTAILGVSEALLREHGAVSGEVASAMAEGARRVFGVDYALSITGIAGPEGGTATKPVGLVYIALATPEGTEHKRTEHFGDRDMIRMRAAYSALGWLWRHLRGS